LSFSLKKNKSQKNNNNNKTTHKTTSVKAVIIQGIRKGINLDPTYAIPMIPYLFTLQSTQDNFKKMRLLKNWHYFNNKKKKLFRLFLVFKYHINKV